MISNSTRSSAIALRQTLLALSFQFFFVPSKAIQHQNQAIQHLQTSIDRTLPWDKDEALQAIAASMLLSVYEVRPLLPPLPFFSFLIFICYSYLIQILAVCISSYPTRKYRWKMGNPLFAGLYFSAARKESLIQFILQAKLTKEIRLL